MGKPKGMIKRDGIIKALKPWHRQDNESSKAFHAFLLYREMSPKERSLAKVCQKLGKKEGYLLYLWKWSSRNHWVARATAHDDHLAQVRAEAQEQAIRDMADRQAKQGMALQTIGLKRFIDSDGTLKEGVAMWMKDRDAIAAIDIGTKIERTARGEPTEIVRGEHTIRTAKELSDDELAEIIKREENGDVY